MTQPTEYLRIMRSATRLHECRGTASDADTLPEPSIRETMARVPGLFQPMLTWLTAKPLADETRLKGSSIRSVSAAVMLAAAGVALAALLWRLPRPALLLLPLCWLLTVSGLRTLQVVIYHHCSHQNVFRSKQGNSVLGEVISVVLLIKDFKTYRKHHMIHHQSKWLLTHRDETVQDLASVGLLPGLPKRTLYRNLVLSFVSPFTQLRLLLNRFSAAILSPHWKHNLLALAYWGALLGLVHAAHAWLPFLSGWVFPLTILYHVSRTLRLVVEHTWPDDAYVKSRDEDFSAAATIAVFPGEALPEPSQSAFVNVARHMQWVFRMATVHLAARTFVLVGDTPCHDFHHRNPACKDWFDYVYLRQAESVEPTTNPKVPYRETWGFMSALDRNLEALSRAAMTPEIGLLS